MLPPPAPPDNGKEKCCICLSFRKCAHIRKHQEKGGKQLCGPTPICVPCSSELCVKFHGDKHLGVGQFICPICRASLGSKRRALEEGAEANRWRVEQDTPMGKWQPVQENAMQRAMRERNIAKLRQLWDLENPQGVSTLAPISGGDEEPAWASQQHIDEMFGNSNTEEGETLQPMHLVDRRGGPKRQLPSASPDGGEQEEEATKCELGPGLESSADAGHEAGNSPKKDLSTPRGQAGSTVPEASPRDGKLLCKRKDSQRSVASPCRGIFSKRNTAGHKQIAESSGQNQAQPIIHASPDSGAWPKPSPAATISRAPALCLGTSCGSLSDLYVATVPCTTANASRSSTVSSAPGQKVLDKFQRLGAITSAASASEAHESVGSASAEAHPANSAAMVASERKADGEETEEAAAGTQQAELATNVLDPDAAMAEVAGAAKVAESAEERSAAANEEAEPAVREVVEAAQSRDQETAEIPQNLINFVACPEHDMDFSDPNSPGPIAQILIEEEDRRKQKEKEEREAEEAARKAEEEVAKRAEEEARRQQARKAEEEEKRKQEEVAKRAEEEARRQKEKESLESQDSACKPGVPAATCKDDESLLMRIKQRQQLQQQQQNTSSSSSSDAQMSQMESKPSVDKKSGACSLACDTGALEHESLQKRGQARRRVQPIILSQATQACVEKSQRPATSAHGLGEEFLRACSAASKTSLSGASSVQGQDVTSPKLEHEGAPGLQELDRTKLSRLSPISQNVDAPLQDDQKLVSAAATETWAAAPNRECQEQPGSQEQATNPMSTLASPISQNVATPAEAHQQPSPAAATGTSTAAPHSGTQKAPGSQERAKTTIPTPTVSDSRVTPDQVARYLKETKKTHLKSKQQPHVCVRVKRGERSRRSSSQIEHRELDTPAREPSVAQAAAHTWKMRKDAHTRKIVATGLLQLGGPETTFQVTSQQAGGSLDEAERVAKACVKAITAGASSDEWRRLRAQMCTAACCRAVSSPALASLQGTPLVPAFATRKGDPKTKGEQAVRCPNVSSSASTGTCSAISTHTSTGTWSAKDSLRTPVQAHAAQRDQEVAHAAEAQGAIARSVEPQPPSTSGTQGNESVSPPERLVTPPSVHTRQDAIWDPYLESPADLTAEALVDQNALKVADPPPESPPPRATAGAAQPETPIADLQSEYERLRDLASEAKEEARRQEDRQQQECQRLREQAAKAEEEARRREEEGRRRIIELQSKSKQLEEQASKVQSRVGLASRGTKSALVASGNRRLSLQAGAMQKLRQRQPVRLSLGSCKDGNALLAQIKKRLRPACASTAGTTAPPTGQQGSEAPRGATCTSDLAVGAASSSTDRTAAAVASAASHSHDVPEPQVLKSVDLKSPGLQSKGHSHASLQMRAAKPQKIDESITYNENQNPNAWPHPPNVSPQNGAVFDRKEVAADPKASQHPPDLWSALERQEEEAVNVGKRQTGCAEVLPPSPSPAAVPIPAMASNTEELEVLTMPEPRARRGPRSKRAAAGQAGESKSKRRRLPTEEEELALLNAETRPLEPPLVGSLQPRRRSLPEVPSRGRKKTKGEPASGASKAEDPNFARLRKLMQAYGH